MNMLPVLDRRRAGILLHITSLPSGDLTDAWAFVDFLAETGATVWQMLPLGPTHSDRSPYHCRSMHAIDPALLSRPRLATSAGELAASLPRETMLQKLLDRITQTADTAARIAFESYCAENAYWLEDFALFEVLREMHDHRPWWEWPAAIRDRDPKEVDGQANRHVERLNLVRLEQFLLAQQFDELRRYAHARGVRLFGDMPIFVAHDSAEVWAHRQNFKLDDAGQPRAVAGVPPDYFSATGQRWGNPTYDWHQLAADGFGWWHRRLAVEFQRFDLVRIDHFRGFESCWEIPVSETTAINGRWVPVPGGALFSSLREHVGSLPLVAEDLGIITSEVTALRKQFGFPGMLVLQFAFDGSPDNPYLPHNHVVDSVVYTGTHDNDTTLSWYQDLDPAVRTRVVDYLGTSEPMPRSLVHAALNSVAILAIVPMQDILGAGKGNRMNTPGTTSGNWRWQFDSSALTAEIRDWWTRAIDLAGRHPAAAR